MPRKPLKRAQARDKAFAAVVVTVCSLFASLALVVIAGATLRDMPVSEWTVSEELVSAIERMSAPDVADGSRTPEPDVGSPTQLGIVAPVEKPAPKKGKKRLVIVIDDVGWNVKDLPQWLRIPGPITFAILPGQIFSEEARKMIRAAGKEYILHQPMEAITDFDPGPGAIYGKTTPEEAIAIVERNLALLPGAKGINHHMGSLVSRDEAVMTAVLQVAKRHDIYYLDSFTIHDTAVPRAALATGIRYWERDVFLDNSQDRESVLHYLREGMRIAEKRGYAIMIGHVWSAELAQTLYDLYPQLVEEGFSLSTISRIMLEDGDAGSGN